MSTKVEVEFAENLDPKEVQRRVQQISHRAKVVKQWNETQPEEKNRMNEDCVYYENLTD